MISGIVIIIVMALMSQAQVLFAFSSVSNNPSTFRRCGALPMGLFDGVAFSSVSNNPSISRRCGALPMGLFDSVTKAFTNQNFKSRDQRVRASHILLKGDDSDQVLTTVRNLLGEIQSRVVDEGDETLPQVFAELARRESQCPSKDQGGDLGLFGKGKMVKEFDLALFPDDESLAPKVGMIVGPIVTDFGIHIILMTRRDENKDQVEEKLARIDPDALR